MNEDSVGAADEEKIGLYECSGNAIIGKLDSLKTRKPDSTVTIIQYSGEKQLVKTYKQGSGGISMAGDNKFEHYRVEVPPTPLADLGTVALSEGLDASSQLHLCLQDLYHESFLAQLTAGGQGHGTNRRRLVVLITDGDLDFKKGLMDADGNEVTAEEITTKWTAFLDVFGKMYTLVFQRNLNTTPPGLAAMYAEDEASKYLQLIDQNDPAVGDAVANALEGILNEAVYST